MSVVNLSAYDAGQLNDYGGGNVEWWLDYIRAELGRAHDFYEAQLSTMPEPASNPENSWRVELDEVIAHLGAAIMQSTDRDDRIIMDHVKAAHEIAKIVRRKA